MKLDRYDYEGPYSLLIARQLPNVPVGVDPKHPAVVNIVNQIIPHHRDILAFDTVQKAEAELRPLRGPFVKACDLVDHYAHELDRLEEAMVKQAEAVLHAKASYVQVNTTFNDAYKKVVQYWREEQPGVAEKYASLVRTLKEYPKSDWEEVRQLCLFSFKLIILSFKLIILCL